MIASLRKNFLPERCLARIGSEIPFPVRRLKVFGTLLVVSHNPEHILGKRLCST